MPARTDSFDLGRLQLTSGEGRRLDLEVHLGEFAFGEDTYEVAPDPVPVTLDVSRTTGNGYALRLRFGASLAGPCMRCLEGAAPSFAIDVREVDQPGGGEDLESPYIEDDVLDLHGWARDAFALELPVQVICSADCAGLCPECGENLNTAGPEHHHERAPDPRWAKLSELRFE